MRMFRKLVVGVVLGAGVAFLAAAVFLVGAGGGEAGSKAAIMAGAMGFLLTFALAVTASSSRYAWGRGLLLAALLCFAMPAATVVVTAASRIVHSGKIALVIARTGNVVGALLANAQLSLVAGGAVVLLGVVFLIVAYVSLQKS